MLIYYMIYEGDGWDEETYFLCEVRYNLGIPFSLTEGP